MKVIFSTVMLFNLLHKLLSQKVSNPINKYKIVTLSCLFILLTQNPTVAQTTISKLKPFEIDFLKILLSDSIHDANFNIPSKTFNFGLDEALFGNFNIIKKKENIFLQAIGTGRLYKVRKDGGEIVLDRIDKTIHSGTNFFGQSFVLNDTLYQFGGLGFWQIRGILTMFSEETKQWELIKSNRTVTSYFVDNNDAIMHLEKGNNPSLYVSNSYFLKYFPQQYEIESVDSVFSYNIHKHEWTTLGKLNPLLKKILSDRKSRELEINIDNFYVTQNRLDFYWIDFKNNLFGNLKPKYNDRLRIKWLSFYNDEKKVGTQTSFQFLMGNKLYYVKYIEGDKLKFVTENIDLSMIDYKIVNPVYLKNSSILYLITNFILRFKYIFLFLLLTLTISLVIYLIKRRKEKLPKEVVNILNNNFFNSLTIVEKELIEELYQHHLKGEALSTRLINKIIGVQQKDTLTQNKSRSDYFIRINQKFKMATQHSEPLIIKHRDSADKRQYNYSINPNYIVDIEKLLND